MQSGKRAKARALRRILEDHRLEHLRTLRDLNAMESLAEEATNAVNGFVHDYFGKGHEKISPERMDSAAKAIGRLSSVCALAACEADQYRNESEGFAPKRIPTLSGCKGDVFVFSEKTHAYLDGLDKFFPNGLQRGKEYRKAFNEAIDDICAIIPSSDKNTQKTFRGIQERLKEHAPRARILKISGFSPMTFKPA